MTAALERYRDKRDFAKTPEPADGAAPRDDGARDFVVHMHDATRLHFDVRLELDGVLKSFAVPKGPSLDPKVKRLAVETEDHPLAYLSFEGVIPAGEYGGGPMIVWDRGLWFPIGDAAAGYAKGHLRFRLEGEKLRGAWSLVRTRGTPDARRRATRDRGTGEAPRQWLLLKHDDAAASRTLDIVAARPESARTGRTLDEVRAAGVEATLRDVVRAGDPARVPGARETSPMSRAGLQRASAAARPPSGPGWVAEVKHDGYRLLAARRASGEVTLVTRGGQDWTRRFPAIVEALAGLPCREVCLDGEAVVLDAAGKSDFAALQHAIGRDDGAVTLIAFDLLALDGWDLTGAALVARKEVLRLLLARAAQSTGRAGGAAIRYGEHFVAQQEALHALACELGLEGTVAKRADAPYVAGRSRTWLKVKCLARQELVVIGWTDPKGGRTGLGALLLGVYDEGRLRYAGKVGTGFDEARLHDLARRLAPLARATSPLPPAPRRARRDIAGVHWVEPRLVAEVSFREWTRDGLVRQASFVGLRDDKRASEVVRELAPPPASASGREAASAPATRPASAPATRPAKARALTHLAGVRVTHPDKVMFPDPGLTKIALAQYYLAIAPRLLPLVRDRPLSLVRCPDGIAGACFYQKHAHKGVPAALRRVAIAGEDEPYLVVDDVEGLLSLVHFGVVELHVWGARAASLERPDMLVLDLDPASGVPWSRVVTTARALKAQLEVLGLVPFVRATGGKGLHVVAPLAPSPSFGWDALKTFAHGFALALARRDPRHHTAKLAKEARAGRIFLDYLRNARQATAVASWSVRAKPGAPVATPLTWDALAASRGPLLASVRDVRAALDASDDPWRDFEASRRAVTRAMRDAVASLAR